MPPNADNDHYVVRLTTGVDSASIPPTIQASTMELLADALTAGLLSGTNSNSAYW